MGKRGDASVDPVGTAVSEDIERARRESPAYRAEHDRLAGFEQLARIVIMRRAQLDLSHEDLARRMGASVSTVSRIESGQHSTSTRTLKRAGEALEGRAVIGFDFGNATRRKGELVSL